MRLRFTNLGITVLSHIETINWYSSNTHISLNKINGCSWDAMQNVLHLKYDQFQLNSNPWHDKGWNAICSSLIKQIEEPDQVLKETRLKIISGSISWNLSFRLNLQHSNPWKMVIKIYQKWNALSFNNFQDNTELFQMYGK